MPTTTNLTNLSLSALTDRIAVLTTEKTRLSAQIVTMQNTYAFKEAEIDNIQAEIDSRTPAV